VIFTGIASLLSVGVTPLLLVRYFDTRIPQATQGPRASQGALRDILERIKNVFRRLETYVELPPTTEMMDIIVKIMTEVILILALVTKEIKQGRLSEFIPVDRLFLSAHCCIEKFLKKVVGRSDMEDALRRLDKLTQEEHRMTSAQGLRASHDGAHFFVLSLPPCPLNPFSRPGNVYMRREFDDQKRSSPQLSHRCHRDSTCLIGNQLRQDLTNWLKPPDPYINYNTATNVHHKGTGMWFTERTTFQDWKESSSLLWIHGKRTFSGPLHPNSC
jgi:hypothetical protein